MVPLAALLMPLVPMPVLAPTLVLAPTPVLAVPTPVFVLAPMPAFAPTPVPAVPAVAPPVAPAPAEPPPPAPAAIAGIAMAPQSSAAVTVIRRELVIGVSWTRCRYSEGPHPGPVYKTTIRPRIFSAAPQIFQVELGPL